MEGSAEGVGREGHKDGKEAEEEVEEDGKEAEESTDISELFDSAVRWRCCAMPAEGERKGERKEEEEEEEEEEEGLFKANAVNWEVDSAGGGGFDCA
jgi:hypothetical protein